MKVAHVVTLIDDAQSYGGPVSVAVTQLRALARNDVEGVLIAGWRGTKSKPPTEFEGVRAALRPVLTLAPGLRFSGLHSPSLLATIYRETRRADVVHIHLARDLVPLSAAVIAKVTGTPFVTQTHGMIKPDSRPIARIVDATLTRRSLRSARARFSLTSAEDEALAHILKDHTPGTRLRNAVEIPSHDAHSRPRSNTDPREVLFLARLHPRKRVADFIEAAKLLTRSLSQSLKFTIIGPDDGDLEKVETASTSAELARSIRYEGAISHADVASRLAQADVYVLPSDHEPFPMSLLEALASGVPSVCTTGCGIAEELRTWGAAIVVQPGSPQQLAAAIESILTNQALADSLATRGAEFCRKSLGTAALAEKLQQEYCVAIRADKGSKPPILWVTNVAPSYRTALWQHMCRSHPVDVAVLSRDGASQSWHRPKSSDTSRLKYIKLNTRAITWGRAQLFLPNLALIRTLIAHRNGVVITDGWEAPAYWLTRLLQPVLGYSFTSYYRGLPSSHRFSGGAAASLRRWFFAGCSTVFAGGPSSTEAIKQFKVPSSRISIIPNSVDNAHFARARERRRESPRHCFGYVGQFIPRKNVDLLVQAFALASAADDTLVLIGEGPEKAHIEAMVHKLNLAGRVRILPAQSGDDLLDAYATIDTLALVSSEEIWGLVVNEALAAGCSVVVSRNCGVVEALEDLDGAVLCDPTISSIAEALTKAKTIMPSTVHPLDQYDVAHVGERLASTLSELIP